MDSGAATEGERQGEEVVTKKRERPFQLIKLKASGSEHVIECLRDLLEEAEAGRVIGLSYAVMRADRKFFFRSCGEAHRNPAFATAMAATLLHGELERTFGRR